MKYYRMLNSRLNKALPTLLIVGAVQVIVGAIILIMSTSYSGARDITLRFMSHADSLINMPIYAVTLVSVLSAIIMAVIISGLNQHSGYMTQGVRRSTNSAINLSCAVIVAIVCSTFFVLATLIANLLHVAVNTDVIISSLYEVLRLDLMWTEMGAVFIWSLTMYVLICFLHKVYDWKKVALLVAIAGLVLIGSIFIFIIPSLLSNEEAEIMMSIKGQAIGLSIVALIASGAYIAMEMNLEVRR